MHKMKEMKKNSPKLAMNVHTKLDPKWTFPTKPFYCILLFLANSSDKSFDFATEEFSPEISAIYDINTSNNSLCNSVQKKLSSLSFFLLLLHLLEKPLLLRAVVLCARAFFK